MTRNGDGTFELSPEAADLLRRQFEMDYEDAGPKAHFDSLTYKGVRLESRYDALREYEAMKKIIDAMPELMARRLAWMWCDSKCGANYVVGVKPSLFVPQLNWDVESAVIQACGGHNGITIEDGESPFTGARLGFFDCDWGEADCWDDDPSTPIIAEDHRLL